MDVEAVTDGLLPVVLRRPLLLTGMKPPLTASSDGGYGDAAATADVLRLVIVLKMPSPPMCCNRLCRFTRCY